MEVKEIWQSFHKELHGYILRRVRNTSLADDILQDVFEKITRKIRQLEEVENIQEYLYKMTRNTIADTFRKRKLIFEELAYNTSEQEEESNAEPPLNQIVSSCCVRPFIQQLPEKYKEAVLATDLNNISQKELAEKLDISYSGAKSRVQRGREKLKDMLQDCCNFEYDSYGNLNTKNAEDCDC